MDMGQHARKVLYSSNALGPAGSEHFRQGIDSGGPDADVVHRNPGVVGLLDSVCGVGPGITALITFIGDEAVTDDDQQAPLGALGRQAARQMAKWRTEPGVSARVQAQPARRQEPAVLE